MPFLLLDQVESRAAAASFCEQGLTDNLLREAIAVGFAARAGCSATDPPGYSSTTAHVASFRFLHAKLRPLGWRNETARGQCRLVTPDGRYALVFATGDHRTGLRVGVQPRTKSPKGSVTMNAVQQNRNLSLFPVERDEGDASELWFVLVNWWVGEDSTEVRYEVSRPVDQLESGFLHTWDSRVIHEPIRIDPDPSTTSDVAEETEEEIDFEIRRK